MGCGGGCGCAPCAGPSALELAANPAKRKLHAMQQSQQIGDFLPPGWGKFQGDVDALKRSIHPSMVATDGAVASCAGLSPSEVDAWREFFKSWNAYRDEPTPLLVGTGRRYVEGLAYREQLAGWQEHLRPKCKVPGAVPKADESDASNISSAVRWGAVAVIAAAAVYGLRTVLP